MSKLILETPRLELHEMTMADLDFVAAMLADPDGMRFHARPLTHDEAIAWVERQLGRYAKYGHGHWLVRRKDYGERIGQAGLVMQTVDGVDEPEIGYRIHPPFWRRGYATEAALAVRDHAFGVFGYPRVISLIRPFNLPSQGVARKLGMTPEKITIWFEMEHIVFAQVRR